MLALQQGKEIYTNEPKQPVPSPVPPRWFLGEAKPSSSSGIRGFCSLDFHEASLYLELLEAAGRTGRVHNPDRHKGDH